MKLNIEAIRERLKPRAPTGQDNPTCAKCGEFVSVIQGSEWEDGDICSSCTDEYASALERDVSILCDEVERLRETVAMQVCVAFDVTRERNEACEQRDLAVTALRAIIAELSPTAYWVGSKDAVVEEIARKALGALSEPTAPEITNSPDSPKLSEEAGRGNAVGAGAVGSDVDERTQIKAAHPTRTGRHDLYAEAMRLVGERHAKAELVELVNWLLYRLEGGKGEPR